ncbi:hypothetical protein A3E39_03240 [Candidatus Uhrbacteria bacterium RIFCSPHIGHO2_12_FULL_60_25]|uniref:Uncharacterized protein n=1 Tax=Candidatus Uhrbacteria bacterium RIFCSPHIGHO2_12_FULL_60_25 TaxID=1802399 RepID=A0A1F7UQ17_9BACT|nr:MAG: hypothetical protein A3D73_00740 [Candidatus Uhrbacteria bacterium RIFCSPHIGHO2_02_FULL_60_44]OGL79798.1 MAG: hypothetical protein A3E39_03240 [Candidatus Uhrbacteria bacterium RIFCSPHIGHO2_12_FULL_60_25]
MPYVFTEVNKMLEKVTNVIYPIIMNSLKNPYLIAGAVVLTLLAFAFYWYEWRPTQIKKHCYYVSAELKDNLLPTADLQSPDSFSLSNKSARDNYNSCLNANGL